MCPLNTLFWGCRPLDTGMDVLNLDGGLIFGWTSQDFWTPNKKKQDIYHGYPAKILLVWVLLSMPLMRITSTCLPGALVCRCKHWYCILGENAFNYLEIKDGVTFTKCLACILQVFQPLLVAAFACAMLF